MQNEKFYETLQQIHDKQGVALQREPILGGKKLDLYMIFNLVMQNGGYSKVTQERAWKRISNYFQLPETCTNSAFVFKQLYQRHLLAFENMTRGQSLDQAISSSKHANPVVEQILKKKVEKYPEDDGKEEKYIQGGWQNRLALALKSNLPNEVDWAFNKLVKLSFQLHFYVGFIPGLPETLIDHTLPFFDHLILNTSPYNFETTLNPETDNSTVPEMAEITVFNVQESAELLERVLQALHVIRNMSFMNENAQAFSRDHRLLTILAKSLALPPDSSYNEVQQYALDIFENMAKLIQLRGPSDFYLACLKKMIFGSDRSRILGALRCLIKLLSFDSNEKVVIQIDTPVIQRLIQLLLVKDEEIVMNVMEFLYLFSNISPEAGVRITNSVRFNVLKLLLKFLHWRGFGMEVFKATVYRPPDEEGSDAKPHPPPNMGTNQRAIDLFYAAYWLQSMCEVSVGYKLLQSDFHAEYQNYCQINQINALPVNDVLKLAPKIFTEVITDENDVIGLKPREAQPPPPPKKSPADLFCGVANCTEFFTEPKDLWKHVESHSFSSLKCSWKHCKKLSNSKTQLMLHLQTHIPSESIKPKSAAKKDSKPHIYPDPNDELKGIPLSALLVIRNISRHPHNHSYFVPFEKDLSAMLTNVKFNRIVGQIFAELK
ncbi:AT-rich interactive domain-containing protein 2 [Terramyces sp. JEL0728]|nr:AT-rich interactive domain-containing protein 2 [Terramyces sp. JEL0728]